MLLERDLTLIGLWRLKMYCPNCGNQSSQEQKFCRSCGMDLQSVTQAVATHLSPNSLPESQGDVMDKHEWARMWKRSWGLGFAIMFIGIFLLGIGRKIIHDEIVALIGVLILLIGIWPLLYPFFSMLQVKEGTSRQAPRPIALPSNPVTTNPLPERQAESVLSITERTTDLLSSQRNVSDSR